MIDVMAVEVTEKGVSLGFVPLNRINVGEYKLINGFRDIYPTREEALIEGEKLKESKNK